MKINKFLLLVIVVSFFSACNSDDSKPTKVTQRQVIANYAYIVCMSYKDSYSKAIKMQQSINAFLEAPTTDGFEKIKEDWKEARKVYGQTEAYRETNSPVDVAKTARVPWGINNERQMNAWPIDESYIDYVAAGTQAYAGSHRSIISNSAIPITQAKLAALNQNGNPKNISTGWHAIEFLLWGQDNTRPVEKKPGLRKYTDYTTALHKERRAQYLKVVTELLISDLKALVDTWKPEGTYRKVFEGLKKEVALKQLINGAFFMAGNELSEKRMIVAVDSSDGIDGSGQEDEQSCFADYTHKDIEANAKGIYNVIFGKYGDIKGASFYNLVVQKDATTAKRLKDAADLVMKKVEVISKHDDPFDLLITKEKSIDANPGPVMQAVKALKDWADQISAAASSIDIKLQ